MACGTRMSRLGRAGATTLPLSLAADQGTLKLLHRARFRLPWTSDTRLSPKSGIEMSVTSMESLAPNGSLSGKCSIRLRPEFVHDIRAASHGVRVCACNAGTNQKTGPHPRSMHCISPLHLAVRRGNGSSGMWTRGQKCTSGGSETMFVDLGTFYTLHLPNDNTSLMVYKDVLSAVSTTSFVSTCDLGRLP